MPKTNTNYGGVQSSFSEPNIVEKKKFVRQKVTLRNGALFEARLKLQVKRFEDTGLFGKDKKRIAMTKGSPLKQMIVDSSSPIEIFVEHQNQAVKGVSGSTTDTSAVFGMIYLKKKKERQLRQRKYAVPPPNFYRMKKRAQQKKLLAQKQEEYREYKEEVLQRQEERKQIVTPPLPGFESLGFSETTPENCYKARRFESIVNGKITDVIPEECEICLGSPSNKERVREFKRMYHQEQRGFQNE